VKGGAERERPRLGPGDDAARKRAAVETYARNQAALRRTAQRYSLCADDAEDALQRGLEILLRKAPTDDPRELVKWTQTVVKHEALAVRRERERILAGPAGTGAPSAEDRIALLPTPADGPPERAERRESIARSREALQALKPQELRALTLLAEGYTYAEIGEITGWTRTKINRCLAEGRERFRQLIARNEDGSRCREMRASISAFCDGELGAERVAELREHLRACAHCRATLRAYRAAPRTAAALAPALPLHRSLWERVQEAFEGVASRLGRGNGGSLAQVATGGGAGGPGIVGLTKVAAVCLGTAGGAAACVATGLVPSPIDLPGEGGPPPRLERHPADAPPPGQATPRVVYEPAPAEQDPQPQRKPGPDPKPRSDSQPTDQEPAAESEPVAPEPVPESSAAEPAPAPEPVAEPAPVTSAGSGSPAGEFGP
jgi:RNA polymerase sigma factor (sigma-70 family)